MHVLNAFIDIFTNLIYGPITIQSKFQITEVATQLRLKEHRSAPSLHPCHYLGAQRLLAQ